MFRPKGNLPRGSPKDGPWSSSEGGGVSGTVAREPADGLRARKRAAMVARIERSALDLAIQHGYDNVTVDMICGASMVSPRTFFNYFGSKEGAVLGAAAPEPSDEERNAFVQSPRADVLADLLDLLASVMSEHDQDRDVIASRRSLVIANPSLMTKQLDRMGEQESKLTELVLQRLARQGRSGDAADLEAEAGMVVALAGSVMRFSVRRWFVWPDAGTGALEMLQADLALARRVLAD